MSLSELSPTIIVLSLVALLSLMGTLSTPVVSLVTGYDYDANDNPTTADRYGDLKCTYLLAGVTHMRLVQLILEKKSISTGYTVGTLNHFNVRAAICTLFDVRSNREIVEVGSLWLLLLYCGTVQAHYKHRIVDSENEADRTEAVEALVITHDYVLDRMQKELSAAGCRPGNRFDSYDDRYAKLRNAAKPNGELHLNLIQTEALNNCHKLDKLFKANRAQSTFGTRYESLKAKQLFLNNLGTNDPLKSSLMNWYDVQIRWEGTFTLLETDYRNAHMLHVPAVGSRPLSTINVYYSRAFCLLITIVYRLTWEYLLYINTSTGQCRANHLQKWKDFLVDFQNLFCLQDDPDVTALLAAIESHSNVDISDQLEDYLHKINGYLQCVATDLMTLETGHLLSSAHESSSDQADIDKCLKKAQSFITEIKYVFRKVDFVVIRSIVTYINNEALW